MAEELLLYTSEGVFSIYPANICPPGIPVTFRDQAEASAFLRRIITDKAVRHTLFLIFNNYVGKAPVNIPDGQIIKEMAKKLAEGELMLTRRLSGRPAGKDAIDRRPAKQPEDEPESTPDKKTEQKKPARTLFIAPKPEKEIKKDYKIAIEVAGTALTDCCHDRLVSAAVGKGHKCADPKRAKALANARNDDHRHEVELTDITRDSRAIFINPGCNEAADAACPIPLHRRAVPVKESARAAKWPTALVPVVPLAFTDADNSPEKAMPIRNGWLYIYLDGHLWRELYACGDGTLRDVNLALPDVAGADVRAPSGHAVTTVLVPHTLEGETKTVQIAFAEVQWTWRQVCALGGPADDDPRFLPGVIAAARTVPVDQARRDKRFYTLDLSAYPGPFQSADGRVLPIEDAPRPKGQKDPFSRLRDKKIAAVILEDPLLVARRLAGEHQKAWREMEELLQTLAKAPEKNIKEKTYDPGRWFESAVLANQFFFAPFPGFDAWQKLHPAADQKAWQKTRDQRDRMQASLDKEAIDQALGVKQRQELRPKIDAARQPLVDYLTARTRDELDLFVLMLDDYFILPQTAGRENTKDKNPCGYVDGWGVMEQLIARLGDHNKTLDADLFAEPPDTAKLTRENPGTAFLNTLADPEQNHVLHTRLFPKAAGSPVTPDPGPADEHAPAFKIQRFENTDLEEMAPIAGFITHFTRSAVAVDHRRVCHSMIRLSNATCKLELELVELNGEQIEQHALVNETPFEQKQSELLKAAEGALTAAELAALMRRYLLFSKAAVQRGNQKYTAVKEQQRTVKNTVYSKNPLKSTDPNHWRLKDAKPKGLELDEIVSSTCFKVKRPLPKEALGYIAFPKGGPETLIEYVSASGEVLSGPSIKSLFEGRIGWRKWLKKHPNASFYDIKVELIISRKPDLFSRLFKKIKDTGILKRVIVPLAVAFETWNLYNAGVELKKSLGNEQRGTACVDFFGALLDFSALNTAVIFQRIGEAAQAETSIKAEHWDLMPEKWQSKVFRTGVGAGFLGIGAGAYSACLSGRDMVANLRQNDDAAIGYGVMMTGFVLSTVYDVAWSLSFLAGSNASMVCPIALAIAEGPLMWIGLVLVLAGLALLTFVFKEDTPLEEWLANGPFSIQTFSPLLVTVYDETAVGGDLIVDENNILVGLVPCAGKRLIERHGTVVQVDAAGKPVKTIGEIGKPIRSPGPLKDTSGRFAHHRPGDADFGPPPGGSSTLGKYIGTGKTMQFWKEPDGSHLWITQDGILHDCHIVEHSCIKPDPVENHRLSRQGGNIYLTTAEGIFPLGRIGGPIQNREKLLVDRQDDPTDKNNKFRDWCEKPKSAYLALASAVFKPAIELDFSRTARPEVKYPEADPFKGYDFFAHIGIALPHFIEGKSLLFIEMWEKYDKMPCLNYAKRIRLKIAETGPMRNISLTWPLERVYSRYSQVYVKVRVDVYGDGRLCLPLADWGRKTGGHESWTIENKLADRFLMPRKEKV